MIQFTKSFTSQITANNCFVWWALLACGVMVTSCNQKSTSAEEGTTYQLYFMGGQSNMDGYGFTSELPNEYNKTISSVRIFCGNQVPDDTVGGGFGQWMPLSPGFGAGYRATADSVFLSDRFGSELSFGIKLSSLLKKRIAIIKYARGGSSIALGASEWGTWWKDYQQNTTINQWDNFERTVKNALATKDIDGDGKEDTLIPAGILWMQGESDATNEDAADSYLENLTTLMKQISSVFGVADLPVVVCRIEDSGLKPEDRVMPFIELVWEAQQSYAANNDHVSFIQLKQPVGFLPDKWHYQSMHYVDMGEKFAAAVMEHASVE